MARCWFCGDEIVGAPPIYVPRLEPIKFIRADAVDVMEAHFPRVDEYHWLCWRALCRFEAAVPVLPGED